MGDKLKKVAIKLLGRREYSSFELKNKLLERGFDGQQIKLLLAELVLNNWQSDQRFAESYVRSRKYRGIGPLKLTLELEQRGITRDEIKGLIASAEQNWEQLAIEVSQKKFGKIKPKEIKELARRVNYLLARGFTVDQARQAVNYEETL